MKDNKHFVIIISGPTASGKTDFSDMIAQKINGEIINADVGQFYTSLSIGTAKPDWKNQKVPYHLFDILSEPKDLSVVEYKNSVNNKISGIVTKNKTPIIVGGSLFYLKSLLFPPNELCPNAVCGERSSLLRSRIHSTKDIEYSWDYLNKIDPARAAKIHPNDIYRIKRAIDIWITLGIKPSDAMPKFDPPFNFLFIFINPTMEILSERIKKRTVDMINSGWIQEVEKFVDTEWEIFFDKKGLIGYSEILNWIKAGKKQEDLCVLIENIYTKTRQYARKQLIFWKSFKVQILESCKDCSFDCRILEVKDFKEFDFNRLSIKSF
jgi:tRNA dimethylallyltransferase